MYLNIQTRICGTIHPKFSLVEIHSQEIQKLNLKSTVNFLKSDMVMGVTQMPEQLAEFMNKVISKNQ